MPIRIGAGLQCRWWHIGRLPILLSKNMWEVRPSILAPSSGRRNTTVTFLCSRHLHAACLPFRQHSHSQNACSPPPGVLSHITLTNRPRNIDVLVSPRSSWNKVVEQGKISNTDTGMLALKAHSLGLRLFMFVVCSMNLGSSRGLCCAHVSV